MFENGEAERKAIRPDFNRSIFIDFAGAKITSDAGFLLMREVDQRFGIIESDCTCLTDEKNKKMPHPGRECRIPGCWSSMWTWSTRQKAETDTPAGSR